MSDLHKEIDLIQGVITRMTSNSFEVKKWLIGILTGILVFKNDEVLGGNFSMIWILLIPILCFWYLDALFLSNERTYREMYKWVIANRKHTDKYLFDLNTFSREFPQGKNSSLKRKENNVFRMMISRTLWPFYIIPTIFILALMIANFSENISGACCGH